MAPLSVGNRGSSASQRKKGAINPNSWEANFSPHQESEENRLRFLARMSYISFAQYMLYRGLLPKAVYKRRRVEDLIIYCFDQSHRWGHKLSEMMKGIKQAIEKKYVKRAFIMINEDSRNPDVATEVFSISFCYEEDHALSVLDDQGDCIVSMGYKGEKAFRMQAKHIIKKLNAVTKHLKPLKKDAVPYLKLTYYEDTPADYEPFAFVPCQNTYIFKKPATFYSVGNITTDTTAMAFDLRSIYIKWKDVGELDDLLLEQAGYKEGDKIDPMNVTADGCFSTDELSPAKAQPPISVSNTDNELSSGLRAVSFVTPPEAIHVSDSIEKARNEHRDEPIPVLQFGSPESPLAADETDTADEGSKEKRKKTRTSPYVKKHCTRSRNLTPRIDGNRHAKAYHARTEFGKSSVANRSILKSPEDSGAYMSSPFTK